MPVSRGGMSTPDNLQTLCWRCNRTKSNKTPQTGAPQLAAEVPPSATTEVAAPGASYPEGAFRCGTSDRH